MVKKQSAKAPLTRSKHPKDEALQSFVQQTLLPLIAHDGGHIVAKPLGDHQVGVMLTQRCLGCPGRTYTLNDVVKPMIQSQLGADIEVVDITF